jgi:hypothetical protein
VALDFALPRLLALASDDASELVLCELMRGACARACA